MPHGFVFFVAAGTRNLAGAGAAACGAGALVGVGAVVATVATGLLGPTDGVGRGWRGDDGTVTVGARGGEVVTGTTSGVPCASTRGVAKVTKYVGGTGSVVSGAGTTISDSSLRGRRAALVTSAVHVSFVASRVSGTGWCSLASVRRRTGRR